MAQLVYLSLGSNLGDREKFILEALEKIEKRIAPIESISSFYETEPWKFQADLHFLNICASISTELTAPSLLEKLQQIEKELGRKSKVGNGYASRTIDIDIITFGSEIIESDSLQVPHPELENRKFVLLPLQDIAPAFIHPKSAKTIQQILDVCTDESSVILCENK